jgi:hypothetical protein
MLVTLSPSGGGVLRQPRRSRHRAEPPTDAVMQPIGGLLRLFAGYKCEILGPPLPLDDLS